LAPPEKEKPIIEKAIKELQECVPSLTERQKHIRFADQAENGWDAVAEYIGYSFVDDEEDNRKFNLLDRAAGVKRRRKAAATQPKGRRFPGNRDYGYPSHGQRWYEEFGLTQRGYQEYPEFLWYGQTSNYHVPTIKMMP